jgi:hypothetical protein
LNGDGSLVNGHIGPKHAAQWIVRLTCVELSMKVTCERRCVGSPECQREINIMGRPWNPPGRHGKSADQRILIQQASRFGVVEASNNFT